MKPEEEFASRLLESNAPDFHSYERFPDCMTVLCIVSRPEERPLNDPAGITASLERLFSRTINVPRDDCLAVIVPLEQYSEFTEEVLEQLEFIAEEHNARIGVSYAFFDIADLPVFFRQAKVSLELSRRLNMPSVIALYRDYQPYDFIGFLRNQNEIQFFCHPLLHMLKEVDAARGSELYKTLKVYTECKNNIKDAAERLYIHRNTMVHRLDKIREIGNIDIDESQTLLLLRMSYGIEWFMDTYK